MPMTILERHSERKWEKRDKEERERMRQTQS